MKSYDIPEHTPTISGDLSSVLSCYDHLMRERLHSEYRDFYNAVLIAELISEKLDIDLSGGDLCIAYDYISGSRRYK